MTSSADISMEVYREYVTETGAVYRIEAPATLHITDRGSHRVTDSEGVVHRPPRFGGDYVVRWLPRPGAPDYVV